MVPRKRKRNNDIAKQVFDLQPTTLRLIRKLSIMSKYSEQQVLEDLLHGGEAETTELYEEIREWRKGYQPEKDEKKNVPESQDKEFLENSTPAGAVRELDNYPAESTGDLGAVERALASLGHVDERPGPVAESENGAEPPVHERGEQSGLEMGVEAEDVLL